MAGDIGLVIRAHVQGRHNRQEVLQEIPAQDRLVGDHRLAAPLNPEAAEAAAAGLPDRKSGLIDIDGGRRAPVFLCTRRVRE